MSRPLPEDPFRRSRVQRARAAQVSRRHVLQRMGVGAAGLTLAACSTGAGERPTAAEDISDTDKIVRWDNWSFYLDVDEDTGEYPSLEAFIADTGIQATYTEAVDDNNTYYGKVKDQLQLGQDIGADTVCLTDWMVDRLIRFGYVQELDHGNMPNVTANLVDPLKNVGF